MQVSTINPQPTEEVLQFAAEVGAVSISVSSYTVEDGVIWACYDEKHYLLAKCDATGDRQK